MAIDCPESMLMALQCYSNFRVERAWALKNHPAAKREGWLEISDDVVGRGYIRLGVWEGLYSPTKPKDVKDSDIVRVSLSGPTFELRNRFDYLVSQLDFGEQQYFAPILAELVRQATADLEMGKVKDLHLLLDGSPGPTDLTGFEQRVIKEHRQYFLPGYLVGGCLLVTKTVANLGTDSQPSPHVQPSHLYGFVNSLFSAFQSKLQKNAARLGSAIDNASQELHDAGYVLTDKARKAASESDFFHSLYESCPFFFGAYLGFRYLHDEKGGLIDSAGKKRAFSMANACSEWNSRLLTSLLNNFENRCFDFRKLAFHVGEVSKLRVTNPQQAERLTSHFIDNQLFYPSSYRNKFH
jgi:hypothetical protein